MKTRTVGSGNIGGFRVKLLATMMAVVVAVTAFALYFVQKKAQADCEQNLQREFQSELGFVLGAHETRLAAITERCRTLAKAVRIRASLEENDVEDLYLNAAVELRDVLENEAEPQPGPRLLRAEFFRFLSASGSVMSPPRLDTSVAPEAWESQLAMKGGLPAKQQVGYVVVTTKAGRETPREVIFTPIIATDTGEVIGAIVLGFKQVEFDRRNVAGDIKSGICLSGKLFVPSVTGSGSEALREQITKAISLTTESRDTHTVGINGEPHLLFYKHLNPESRFAPAYQVCLYPLAESFARQRQMRWKIIGAGALVLLLGLLASHSVSLRISAPVEKLAEDSAENLAQRHRAEAARDVTEQKYRSIFDNAAEGIFLTNAEGKFLSANPALARIYGYDSPEELTSKLTDLRHQLYVQPGRREEFVRLVNETGSVHEFESEIYHRDGHVIWISENARLVRNETTGELMYYEGLVQDITQRKRAATELLALNAELQSALNNLKSTQQQIIQQERLRALGQMASGIAHDFNNALVPILGFCELLLLSPAILTDKLKAVNYLETIQTAGKDAASVVSRLREFYRPDKSDMVFAPVHIKRLVEQAITLTKPKWKDQAQASGATVHVALELDSVPPVAGEESALREVLTNLIFNAVDAMPRGGTLTLRTRCKGDAASIEVADTGTGMTEEVRRRCLEPFFSTKGERGTGLGLSMVFGIVQRHSGSIDIRSTPGQGTTFVITLPLQGAVEQRAPEIKQWTITQRPLRVLVVDDEAPVRDTLAAVLVTEGHDVEVAGDGAEGLKRFIAGRFDLVLTDKAMPGMNGEQMAAAIKQVAPKMPIILLTGFGLFHDKEEFPDVDVLASKPIRIPALRDAIATAMKAA